jgi:hypothetical protein
MTFRSPLPAGERCQAKFITLASAAHLNGLPAPTMRGMHAPLNHIAIAVVIVGVVVGVGIAIIAIVIPVEAIA